MSLFRDPKEASWKGATLIGKEIDRLAAIEQIINKPPQR